MAKHSLEELEAMRDDLQTRIAEASATFGTDSSELRVCLDALRLLENEIRNLKTHQM